MDLRDRQGCQLTSDAASMSAVAAMEPGPELAQRLATIDPDQLDPGQRVDLLVAFERLHGWLAAGQARVLSCLDAAPIFEDAAPRGSASPAGPTAPDHPRTTTRRRSLSVVPRKPQDQVGGRGLCEGAPDQAVAGALRRCAGSGGCRALCEGAPDQAVAGALQRRAGSGGCRRSAKGARDHYKQRYRR
jgi:hypothetical protein